jgi:uncharacterized protein with von Willebrand factor type A (vWA) domain
MFAAACGFFTNATYAEQPSLQQAAMLSTKIVAGLKNIIEQAENPAAQSDAIYEKSAIVALSEIKQLRQDCEKLEAMLTSGKSLMQTRPLYRSISDRRKNIRFFAEGIEIRNSIRDQAKTTGDLMDELNLLYE